MMRRSHPDPAAPLAVDVFHMPGLFGMPRAFVMMDVTGEPHPRSSSARPFVTSRRVLTEEEARTLACQLADASCDAVTAAMVRAVLGGGSMSGLPGVYVKVKKRVTLADPRRRNGAVVALLQCGHARTSTLSANAAVGGNARMWCAVCTALAAAKKKVETARKVLAPKPPAPRVVPALSMEQELAELKAFVAELKALRPLPMPPYPPSAVQSEDVDDSVDSGLEVHDG